MLLFRYNIVFFLSGGGKFNFQGTKKWLEDSLDNAGKVFLKETWMLKLTYFCLSLLV